VELAARLAASGADLLIETLARAEAGTLAPEKQDSSHATYAPLLKKEDGLIQWGRPAQSIHDRVRGLQPWPGAFTRWRGQSLHIWRSRVVPAAAGTPGRIVSTRPLVVACGASCLEMIEVQLEGRKRMAAADFANGHRVAQNDGLGEPLT
jgi:methionyl-tRNA formyltransferase